MQNNVIVDDDGAIEVFNSINTFPTNAVLARVCLRERECVYVYSTYSHSNKR